MNKVAGCDVAFEIGAGVRVPWKLNVVIKVDMLSSGYLRLLIVLNSYEKILPGVSILTQRSIMFLYMSQWDLLEITNVSMERWSISEIQFPKHKSGTPFFSQHVTLAVLGTSMENKKKRYSQLNGDLWIN